MLPKPDLSVHLAIIILFALLTIATYADTVFLPIIANGELRISATAQPLATNTPVVRPPVEGK